jgi:short-subunit dehydrogenase involved in D-alanine esterification of teichoic acids
MNYKGMTALVTGASTGLGEEFARLLKKPNCVKRTSGSPILKFVMNRASATTTLLAEKW